MADPQDPDDRNPRGPRSGRFIYPAQRRAIENLLADLLVKLPALLVLLVESSGQVLSWQGNRVKRDGGELDLDGLGAWVARDLAASQEITRQTGEYQAFQLVLLQGEHSNIFISEAGHTCALFVQVASTVPLGRARMLIIETAHGVAEVLVPPPTETLTPVKMIDAGSNFKKVATEEQQKVHGMSLSNAVRPPDRTVSTYTRAPSVSGREVSARAPPRGLDEGADSL